MTRRKNNQREFSQSHHLTQINLEIEKEVLDRQFIRDVLYRTGTSGSRRRAILEILKRTDICVNRNHCLQIHQDKDLQRLIKEGKAKQKRIVNFKNGTTYLVLAC